MQTQTRSQSPEGDMTIAKPFKVGFRSTEDPISPERDGRLQLQGISVRTDIGHPAFSRPVGTQCNRKFMGPNLKKVGLLSNIPPG